MDCMACMMRIGEFIVIPFAWDVPLAVMTKVCIRVTHRLVYIRVTLGQSKPIRRHTVSIRLL